jgi:transcriptional regulator with XRE-family HTH domain
MTIPSAADLARVRNALKLTVGELAACIGVSRQSVYNWKSGSEIKTTHAAKLDNLKKAADVILAANMDVSAFSLARKLPGGKTLLETISGDGDGKVAAQSLLQMLNQESAERKTLDERLYRRVRGRRAAEGLEQSASGLPFAARCTVRLGPRH